MSLHVIVFIALITSLVGSAIAIRSLSDDIKPPGGPNPLEKAMLTHPAGKGLRPEEDILNDR